MKTIAFEVYFNSDVVLPATSNTEGRVVQLDFIPGSNFLGMAAKEYASYKDSFAVFHSGKVRFGDATLLSDNERTYKMPLSLFHEKLDDTTLYNHHLIDDFGKFEQLKQKREGFITKNLEEIYIQHAYAQKSAYDTGKRRSKDKAMYGYESLPAGSRWYFEINIDEGIDSEDEQRIIETIEGKQRLGKSKSAQYGQVTITKLDAPLALVDSKSEEGEFTYLYAKSRLALVDLEGNPTYDLQYLLEGLASDQIVYDKTQLRTSTFTPYHGTMQRKTYERAVINSGSVIVLKSLTSSQMEALKQGVGAYRSEGFGEVLINPSFLFENAFALKRHKNSANIKQQAITNDTVNFLLQREEAQKAKLDLVERVALFIKDHKRLYKNISNSQWGTIRSICSSFDDYQTQIRDYVSSGKVTWSQQQIDTLLDDSHSRAFIKLLATDMPKEEEK